jgi:hypothetical protein
MNKELLEKEGVVWTTSIRELEILRLAVLLALKNEQDNSNDEALVDEMDDILFKISEVYQDSMVSIFRKHLKEQDQ